jgi:hypothetical protein
MTTPTSGAEVLVFLDFIFCSSFGEHSGAWAFANQKKSKRPGGTSFHPALMIVVIWTFRFCSEQVPVSACWRKRPVQELRSRELPRQR